MDTANLFDPHPPLTRFHVHTPNLVDAATRTPILFTMAAYKGSTIECPQIFAYI